MFSHGISLNPKVVYSMHSGDCVPRTKDRLQQTMILPTFLGFPGKRKISHGGTELSFLAMANLPVFTYRVFDNQLFLFFRSGPG